MPNLGFLQNVQVQVVDYVTKQPITPFLDLDSPQDVQPSSVTHNSITYSLPKGRTEPYLKVSEDGSIELRVKIKAFEKNFTPSPDGVGWDSLSTLENIRVDLVFPSLNNTLSLETVSSNLSSFINEYIFTFGTNQGAATIAREFPAGVHHGFIAISHQDAFNNPLYQNLSSFATPSTIPGITGVDYTQTANFPLTLYTEGALGWFQDFKVSVDNFDPQYDTGFVALDSAVYSDAIPSVTHNSVTYSFPKGRTAPTFTVPANSLTVLYASWKAFNTTNRSPDGAFRPVLNDDLTFSLIFPLENNVGPINTRTYNIAQQNPQFPDPLGNTIALGRVPDILVNSQPTLYQGFIAVSHTVRDNDPMYANLAPDVNDLLVEDGIAGSDYTQTVRFPVNFLVGAASSPPPPPSCASDWNGSLATDNYLYPPDGTLTIQAPGVLLNDNISFQSNTSCAATVTARLVTNAQYGIVNLSPDGSFSYTPNSGFSGQDSFSYGLSLSGDAFSGGGTATVSLTASSLPPCSGYWDGVLQDDSYSYTVGQVLSVSAPGVLGNDTISYSGRNDCVLTTTARLVTQAQFGIVQLASNGSFIYTPNPGFSGDDYFEYGISVGGVEVPGAASSRVNLTGIPVPPVCPSLWTGVLLPDSYTYQAGAILNVGPPGVLGNDTIAFSGNLECASEAIVVITAQAQHGTVSLSPDGSFSYTPNPGHTGVDTFSYGLSVNNTGVPLAGNATVTLTSFSPESPVIRGDSYTVFANTSSRIGYFDSSVGLTNGVLENDDPGTTGEPDLDNELIATLVEPPGPSFATVSLNDDGSFIFTPVDGYLGTLTWTYRAVNNAGTGVGTVTMTVISPPAPPPPPVVSPILNTDVYSVGKNRTLNVAVENGFLANDVPGSVTSTLIASIVPGKGPINGHLNASPDGSFIYLPSTNFIGTDTFAYQVPSGDGETYVEGKVLITVSEAPPVSPPASPPSSPISTDPITVTINNLSSPVQQTRPSVGYDLIVTPTVLNVFTNDQTGVYSGDVEVSLKVVPASNVLHGQSLQEIVQLKAVSAEGVLFLPKNVASNVTPDIEMVASPNVFIRVSGSYHYLTSKVTLINNSYKSQDLLLTATCDWALAVPVFDNSSVTLQPGEIRETVLTIQVLSIESLDTWEIELKAVDLNGVQKAQDFVKLNVLDTNPVVEDFYISTAPVGTLAFNIGDPVSETLETANTPSGLVRWYSTADTILAAYNLFLTDSGVLQSSGVRGPATEFLATVVCVVEDQASRSYAGKAFQIIIS